MGVGLNGERLEPVLVKMTLTHAIPEGTPSLGMCLGKKRHECRKVAILARPQHEVPMVGHQAIGKQSRVDPLKRLRDDSLEGRIIVVGVEGPRGSGP